MLVNPEWHVRLYFPSLSHFLFIFISWEKRERKRETDIRLLTPLYTIHPPNTLACAAILLTTRLKRIPLPADWYILFDVAWDDIWSICGAVMTLWNDWGISVSTGDEIKEKKERLEKENRWRRSWILAQSRRAVRRWVQERDGIVAA
jgi:hypothetical protein